MIKVRPIVGLVSLVFVLTCFYGCKKNNVGGVSFSASQISLDAQYNSTATVTVKLSQPVGDVAELWFQGLGPDSFQFGSYAQTFINDDSDRVLGVLGVLAAIDTPINGNIAHITLPLGTTSFTIAFTALSSNFAKRAVEYRLKIISAKNASIVSGKDVLTINIDQAPMIPVFASTLGIADVIYNGSDSTVISSLYTLSTSSFTANSPGNYNFSLNYTKSNGNDTAGSFSLTCAGIAPAAGSHTYPTSDGLGSITTNFSLSTTPSALYGNYYVMPNTPGAIVWSNGGHRKVFNTTLGCSFVDF